MVTPQQRQSLLESGYTVFSELVPRALLQDVVELISSFTGADLERPETWYQMDLGPNGIVPVHQHQAIWNVRQFPPVHQVFSELLGTEKLWVRLDRLSFKPPTSETGERNKYIHLDFPYREIKQQRLQGIVYLTDTSEDQGAFCCVPELFQRPDILAQKQDLRFSRDELKGFEVKNIAGRAGSLVVWDSRLPHSGNINTSNQPRLALYISMFPEASEADTREDRIALWQNRQAPEKWRGMPYQQDPEPGAVAELSSNSRT